MFVDCVYDIIHTFLVVKFVKSLMLIIMIVIIMMLRLS